MFGQDSYEVGSIIEYHTFGGALRRVEVTDKEENIKNGRSGFDGFIVGDPSNTVWGYDDQISAVVKK